MSRPIVGPIVLQNVQVTKRNKTDSSSAARAGRMIGIIGYF